MAIITNDVIGNVQGMLLIHINDIIREEQVTLFSVQLLFPFKISCEQFCI